MASGAAHPSGPGAARRDVTVRQWVLSVPWPRRYLFAARYEGRAAALGEPGGSTGSVVVVQRFGSALNLNVHFHMLLLDGVFVEDADKVRWVSVPAPTTEEVQQLVHHVAETVERWLDTQGYGSEEVCGEDDDDANGVLLSASVAGRVALGARAGAKVRRLQRAESRRFRLPRLCGESQGYNLHAVVIRQGHRDGLERLCRYVLRPPLARTRLHRRVDGLLVLTLRKPYANGTTDFLFSEVELAQKLAALVPPLRKNGVSYHGVLAPRHPLFTISC